MTTVFDSLDMRIYIIALLILSAVSMICLAAAKGGVMRRLGGLALAGSVSALVSVAACVAIYDRPDGTDVPAVRDTVVVDRGCGERALLLLAMMSVESGFNPMAVGPDGDTGVLQIRQIYVDEVNRILGYKEYNLLDAYDVDRSLDMFDILQGHHNPDGGFIRTIYCHNKSAAYKDRIIREYNRLLLYERMRGIIINRY